MTTNSITGRHNALHIEDRIARRFAVYGCTIKDGVIVSAQVSTEPIEEFRLPVSREAAVWWVREYFEDVAVEIAGEIVRQLIEAG